MNNILLIINYLAQIRLIVISGRRVQKLLRFGCLFIIVFISSSCEKTSILEIPSSPYQKTESTIRSKYDSYAVFKWDQYRELLDKLSQSKFLVLPLNEMRNSFSDSKVIVGLRHDVDYNPFKALQMARIEYGYGIRSTFFFLATAEYSGQFIYGTFVRSEGLEYLYKEIHNTGSEIGIHNDLLSIMIFHDTDPYNFNNAEIRFYHSLDIPVYGTAAHGSDIAQQTVPNYQIFSNFVRSDSVEYQGNKYPMGKHSLEDYGFKYEAYHINYGIYYSDSGGRWNDSEGLNGILKKLESSKPGDRIQILVHPDWWGGQ